MSGGAGAASGYPFNISANGSVIAFTGSYAGEELRTVTELGQSSSPVNTSTCDGQTFPGNDPEVSGDGRFVVFGSMGYVHDRLTGETRQLDFGRTESEGRVMRTGVEDISDDGGEIVFTSGSASLVANDTNSQLDVFVHARDSIPDYMSTPTEFVLADNVWEMLSLPCPMPPDLTVDDVFGDDIPGEYGASWIVYTHDPLVPNAYTDITASGRLEPGQGFWITQISGNVVTLDLPRSINDLHPVTSTACADSHGCYEIELSGNADAEITWNMVGNPFSYGEELQFDELRAQSEGGICADDSGCSLTEAYDKSLIFDVFYNYNSQTQLYDEVSVGDSFSPWQGFWVGALEGVNSTQAGLLLPFAK
ncbi:hypothetical protein [Granulosicoccus antarcticus]|uniref:Uncharacterized protein n=1 Tax=Granulosicoccus antarcticus IMCC3135 TaxID=1192854 RepID=A0A2Z2P233_9GAMM|nr:hypothetical protein [Granulosicoccus antarcticus]ASJ74577.1 hypothetical protein IMCC3135_22535 [Granulosicoccus antarcticus IMCC3135]